MIRLNSAKIIVGLLILLLSVVSLLQCNKSVGVLDWVSTVQGTVTDSITGAPIDSAVVFYDEYSNDMSDSLGQYRIDRMGNPAPVVRCRKEGYVTKTIDLDIVTGKRLYDSIDFQLVPVP